jgi:methylated-DNA-[protein]-cysteine S-methyltransferase
MEFALKGGMHMEAGMSCTRYASPIGPLLLAGSGDLLAGLWMEGQKYFPGAMVADMPRDDDLPVFVAARDWLDRYFAGKRPRPSELPLAPDGSDFRKAVWEILCAIPYGEVTTYGRIAAHLAARMDKESMSCQAVGGAVAHNPIAIIIPCHRVVGADGCLTGYAGGIERKARLLGHEGVDMDRLYIPAEGLRQG